MNQRGRKERPEVLKEGPMHYAPVNELGVVYLFSYLAKKRRLRVEHIQSGFPDCIAYQKIGGREKRIRIEFEFRSRNFKTHRIRQEHVTGSYAGSTTGRMFRRV